MQRYSIRTIIYSQESIIYLARVCHGMEWNGMQCKGIPLELLFIIKRVLST